MRECKELEKYTYKFLIERENKSRWWYLLKLEAGGYTVCLKKDTGWQPY